MANTSLMVGVPTNLAQNVSYALPAHAINVVGQTDCQVSMDESTWIAFACGNSTGLNTSYKFIRSTVASNIVTCNKIGSPNVQSWNTQSIAVGDNPSQSGILRLPNVCQIRVRNNTNTSDLNVIESFASGIIMGGAPGSPGFYFNSELIMQNRMQFSNSASILMAEKTAPPAVPPADCATIWLQDNGAGKTQLMIQFNTGAPIAIATQA